MKTFIIDLGYIIWGPSILSLNKKDKIIVPRAVLYEIESYSREQSSFSDIARLIRDSENKGFISIEEPTELIKNLSYGLSLADIQVLSLAKDYSLKGIDAIIVSAETKIRRVAKELNFKVIDRNDFTKLIKESEKDKTFFKKANEISRNQLKYIIGNTVISLIAGYSFNIGWDKIDLIVTTMNVWGTILLVIFLGILAYWIRGRYLLFYSIFEILIGFSTSLRVFLPDFNYDKLSDISFFQIIAGIYIVVRGLDNFGKAIKKTRLNYLWEKLFYVQ